MDSESDPRANTLSTAPPKRINPTHTHISTGGGFITQSVFDATLELMHHQKSLGKITFQQYMKERVYGY